MKSLKYAMGPALIVVASLGTSSIEQDSRLSLEQVKVVSVGHVYRNSDTKNAQGLPTPPWKDAAIQVFFRMEPRIGDKVTVIPEGGVAPFDLSVTTTEKIDIPESPIWWKVNLEAILGGAIFDAPARPDRADYFPFDVIVVYPAVKGARAVSPATLDPASLPPYTTLETVSMAADLDGDGFADVLISEYCCKASPARSARRGCDQYDDYVCREAFLMEAGQWKKVYESYP